MTNRPFRSETFGALLDRIIPADDFPSASQAGVPAFILDLCDAGLVGERNEIFSGIASLDTCTGDRFDKLTPAEQDRLIASIAARNWFRKLCALAGEGYYANPANGANPNAASWRMIGYQPGLAEGPDGPPADPDDNIRGRLRA